MSLIVARQFGDRIIVVSDTMISDKNEHRPNILPGRLKSIVIDWSLSIAYAGTAVVGLEAVRHASNLFAKNRDLNEVLLFLKNENEKTKFTESSCDFLVTSHVNGPSIFKIWAGEITSGQPVQWIGNSEPLVRLRENELLSQAPDGLPETEHEEYRFVDAMRGIWLKPAAMAEHNVGGFFVAQLGSPNGHCYISHAASVCSDTVIMPPGLTEEQLADRASGMTEYKYNVQAPLERGVAVLAAFLEQLKTGYIYQPLIRDDPDKLSPATLMETCDKMTLLAQQAGGRISKVDLSP
jgi:hypothetical protein